MTKSIKNILIIFFIFQQRKNQISKIYQNRFNSFCDETLHLFHAFTKLSIESYSLNKKE